MTTAKANEIETRVKKIVVEQLGVKEEEISPESSFVDDLGADSLDTVELVMALEEEFETEIPDEDAEKIITIKDAVKYVTDRMEKETKAIRITKDEWIIKIFGNKITSDKNFERYDKNITELATDIAFEILKSGGDVIIDEGFWEKSYRNDIKKQLSELGVRPILYYVECPVEKMRERIVARSENPTKDSFEISGEMFDSYVKYWEPPTEDEEFILAK